ncbi:MAG: uncharacterized protein H6R05_1057 [Burkholderiaceae bacterium]|nr:uncharacterized protein [Burkholderiaceae bacterium]
MKKLILLTLLIPMLVHAKPSVEKNASFQPVFNQMVFFQVPKGFNLAPDWEQTASGQYIQERVLNGENVNTWTQMITLTGHQNLANNPQLSPVDFLNFFAQKFHDSCPTSFSALALNEEKVAGIETASAVIGCGTLGNTSETALIVIVKGKQDYYTLQWAEHTKASKTPLSIDKSLWLKRLKNINPIRLCQIPANASDSMVDCIGDLKSDFGM